jgi:putative holliday junction resolvase
MTAASYAFKRRLTHKRRSATPAQAVSMVSRSAVSCVCRFARGACGVLCGAMPALILPLTDAEAHWPERGALVGLDLGTKTIGVAVSDPDRRLATGVETIQRKAFKSDATRLLAIAGERNAVGFVLGLPVNMDASEGPRAQSTRAFARNFSKLTELAIALWDERLSTAAVERELIDMDMSRARRAEVIDEHAAIFILQGALDRLANLRETR